MVGSMLPFQFDDSAIPEAPAWLADIPTGIQTKEALLRELAQRLRFPEYFGANWDALDECIGDLSWLPDGPVVVRHSDIPLGGDVARSRIYLSILSDAVHARNPLTGQHQRELLVVFPPECLGRITWLLGLMGDEEAGR